MKLSDYFKQQQSQHLTSQLKGEIFSRIQKEKVAQTHIVESLNTKRFFFASKKIAYISLSALLVVLVFGGVMLDQSNMIDLGFMSIQSKNPNGVQADYIAEIVDFNGKYTLQRNGLIIADQDRLLTINDNDVVKLADSTQMVFTLNDGTQAKISGPAEFSIKKSESGYQIFITDGKFFRIYCPECESDIEIVTSDTSIFQSKDQLLDVQIAKEDDGKLIVKNNGDTVKVVATKNKKVEESMMDNSDQVSISSRNQSIEIVFADSDLMAIFMEKNDISGSFSISDESSRDNSSLLTYNNISQGIDNTLNHEEILQKENNENTGLDANINVSIGSSINENVDPVVKGIMDVISYTGDVDEVDESIISGLGLSTSDKQVPSENQMKSLKFDLNSFFLYNIFEGIYVGDKVEDNIENLSNRINDLSQTFGYTYKCSENLDSIKSVISQLKGSLENDRYISPSYIRQLEKVGNRCDELKTFVQGMSSDDWNSFKSKLSSSLKLM